MNSATLALFSLSFCQVVAMFFVSMIIKDISLKICLEIDRTTSMSFFLTTDYNYY